MTARKAATGHAGGTRPFELRDTLSWRLHTLHKLSDRASAQAYEAQAGLSMSEGRCLAAIGAFAPLSVNDLARHANLDKGQASRAAQALVERGLVSKQGSGTDARAVVLALTRSGARAWGKVAAVITRRNEEIFGCLSDAQRAQLGRMLDRLLAQARLDGGMHG
jgi:DNA-binding MarR family transcriptional regulator